MIQKTEKNLSRAPEGSILVKKYKKGCQFYFRKDEKDRNGTYLRVAERKLAAALVQKAYDKKALSAARKQWKALDLFLRNYQPNALTEIVEREGELRQMYLQPLEVPDALYAAKWQTLNYESKPFREDIPLHLTEKQERVRSKSEVMIANALYRAGVPYRYECPLQLGTQLIYPDFTILRISDRKEIYWEHLGMMDDAEYRNHALQRIRTYEENGIFPGDQLILTAETVRMPLNAVVLQSIIKHAFM